MQGFYLHTFTFFLLKRACKAFACTLSLFFLLMRVCKAFTCTLSLFAWKFSQHSLPRQAVGRSPQEKFEQSTFVQLLICTLTDPADLTNWGQEKTKITSSQKIVLASRLIEPKEQDLMLRNITTLLASWLGWETHDIAIYLQSPKLTSDLAQIWRHGCT